MRIRITLIFYAIFSTIIFIISILPITSAGGQDATFDSIEVNSVPSVQGVGGEITVEVKANFFGGCCYHLFAYDVMAELTVPENVQIINDLTETFKTVDAIPGGQASMVKFKWIVTSSKPGIYELGIKVSTANCGSREATYLIKIVEGASISNPTIFPSKPSINEEITFSATIRSGNELVTIEKATLYIWRSSEIFDRDKLFAEDDLIYEMTNNIPKDVNRSEQQTNDSLDKYLGIGTAHTMYQVEFSSLWRAPKTEFEKEEFLYYWFNVQTSDNKNITTEVFEQEIIDYEKKSQMLSGTIWSTLIIIVIGVILILTITWKYVNRSSDTLSSRGIFILGSTIFSRPMDGQKENITVSTTYKYRFAFLIILLILTISLMIIAGYLGLFQELITETGG